MDELGVLAALSDVEGMNAALADEGAEAFGIFRKKCGCIVEVIPGCLGIRIGAGGCEDGNLLSMQRLDRAARSEVSSAAEAPDGWRPSSKMSFSPGSAS